MNKDCSSYQKDSDRTEQGDAWPTEEEYFEGPLAFHVQGLQYDCHRQFDQKEGYKKRHIALRETGPWNARRHCVMTYAHHAALLLSC